MSRHDKEIIRDAADHVFALFRDAGRDGSLVYHGYDRARELARTCRDLAKGCDLDDEQTRIALLAAWFHDAGYAAGANTDGVGSAAVARRFLAEERQQPELADAVEACIRAPDNGVLENAAHEVLHDALLVPTAGKDYLRELRLLRREKEHRGAGPVSDVEWAESCIRYVEQHPFRTRHAQLAYNGGRAENLVRLHNLLREQRAEADEQRAQAEKAEKGLQRTIEDLYTIMNRNQLQVLNVADRRTGTMVKVNAIMVSLIVALLLRHIDGHPHLLVPTLLLLAVNLASVLISIVSMRAPRSVKSVVHGVDGSAAAAHGGNLLLVANPMPMTRHEYCEQMEELARDLPALRKAMIDATYFVRRFLGWRANMLRLSYDVFLAGLFLSVFAFVMAELRK